VFHLQIKDFTNKVCEQIKYKPIRQEICEEIENHINEEKENYISDGMEEYEAEQLAIEQMGDAAVIGKSLNKIHKPRMNIKLLFITIILLGFGFLVGYIDYYNKWKVNCITIILCMVPCILIYFFDYRKLQKHSNLMYGIATIILIFCIINKVRNNAKQDN
jgi:hypothetical protein